jgi:uncharacterized protein (TIGR02266 family)
MKLTRVPVDFNVRCGQANGSILKGRALNLSTGGIFIITSEPLVLGERLSVEFLLPGNLTPINVIGESVWCRSYSDEIGQNKPPHVAGMRFIDMPKRYGHLIQNYILEMLSSKSLVVLSRKSPVVPEEFSR